MIRVGIRKEMKFKVILTNPELLNNFSELLNNFSPASHFCTPRKRQKCV